MGCSSSKGEMIFHKPELLPEIKQPKDDKEKRTVTFSEPEYILLQTPRPEVEPVKIAPPPPPPEPPRRAKTMVYQRSPTGIKVPSSAGSRPLTGSARRHRPIRLEAPDIPLPAPRPPRTKRKEMFTDATIFASIDKHALATPKSSELSVDSLSKYLSLPAENDLEKVRAFYRWITNNISYDTDAHFRGKKKPSDSYSVLKLKTAVSSGYAHLLADLCRYAKVPVKVVTGLAKGYDYSPLDIFTSGDDPNHTWNAVYISGDWRIVESAWGAGHLDFKKKFCFSYKEFYFLPDPENMLWTHFPLLDNDDVGSRPWQLVHEPIGLMKFNKTIKPLFRAFEWEVRFLSTSSVLDVWKKVNVTIQSSDLTPLGIVSAQLFHFETGREIRQFSFVQSIEDRKFQVTVKPPIKGKFILKVLANINPKDEETLVLVQYFIRCHETMAELQPYPDHFGFFGPTEECYDLGISRENELVPFHSCNGEIELTLQTTKHLEASVRLSYSWGNMNDIDNFAMLESTSSCLFIRARFPREGFYKLKLLCCDGNGDYKCAVNYIIECRAPALPHNPLPRVYKTARELECRLIEPLDFNLLKHTPVTVRVISPLLEGATLNGHKFEKKTGHEWEVTATTPNAGYKFMISGGSADDELKYKGLYEFHIL